MTAKVSTLPTQRILLAEDDESMRGLLTRALEKAVGKRLDLVGGVLLVAIGLRIVVEHTR